MRHLISSLILLLLAILPAPAGPLGTAFTYQGQLQDGGKPVSGRYDFEFKLYAAPTKGVALGSPATNSAVAVTDGGFMVTLDFGNAFESTEYWLEIGVRTNGNTNTFVSLTPRQPISPAPFALFSQNAASAGTATMAVTAMTARNAMSVAATNLTGVVPLSRMPGNIALLGDNANFPEVGAGSLYGGDITVTNALGFPITGFELPLSLTATNYLSPYGYGGVSPTLNFNIENTNRVFISERVIKDEYVNNPTPIVSGVLGILGGNGDQLTFTHFQFGADILFRNEAKELEIHGFNGNFYTPLLTFIPGSPQYGYINEIQIRNPFDTNSIIFKYPSLAAPSITTEFPGTDLGILPQGQLQLGSLGLAQWTITNGNIIPVLDNTYDIGAANGFRPRNIIAAGNAVIAGGLVVGGANLPSSTIQLNGSIATGIAHITNNYTLGAGDSTVIVDVGGVTVTLPSAAGITGRKYAVKNGPAASSVIRAQMTQTIDGEPVIGLNFPYQVVSVQSDGVQWWIISSPEP